MSRYGSSDSWHKRVQIRLEFCYPVEDVPYLSGVSPEPPCTPGAALPCQIHTHIHTGTRLISVPRTALFANSFLVCTDTFIFLSVTCSLSPTAAHLPICTCRYSDGPMHTNTGRYSREFSISIKWRVSKPNKTLFMFERERKVFDEDPCGIIVVHVASSVNCYHCMCTYLVKRIRYNVQYEICVWVLLSGCCIEYLSTDEWICVCAFRLVQICYVANRKTNTTAHQSKNWTWTGGMKLL